MSIEIEIDCHIVRENLKKGLIHLLSISTTEQLAVIYTKALGSRHLYQSLKSSVIQEYLFQARSHQYLLPNFQEVG